MRAFTAFIAISGVDRVVAPGPRHRRTGATGGRRDDGSIDGRSSAGMSTSGANGRGEPMPPSLFPSPVCAIGPTGRSRNLSWRLA